jgi:hypothetical protein
MTDKRAAADAIQGALDKSMRAIMQGNVETPVEGLRVAARHLMMLTRTSDAGKAERECACEFLLRLDLLMGGVEDPCICRRVRDLRAAIGEAFPQQLH